MQSLHATLPRAEAWAALKKRALALVHRYSEDEPRDEGGKWTDGGGGDEVGFVSPNVGNLTFDQAKASLAGGRQKMLAAASKDIDSRLGKEPADVQNVIGAWSDGAENSLMLEMHGWSENEARVALAMKGYVGDQKSALLFTPDTVGKSFLASFPVKGDIGAIHDAMASDGLQFHTLEPTSSGAIVHVYGDDQATIDKITQAAHGADVKITFGHGEFIGTTKEDGSDREQRDDARKQYDAVIAAAAASPEFSGRDLGKTWDAIRNSWSGKLSEVRSARWAALKRRSHALLHRFDPGESRDEHGRWTDGGGGDFDVDKVEAKTKDSVAAASAKSTAKPLDGSKGQHPGTIASRNPTAKGSVAAYGQPDLASMKSDRKGYEHNIGLFKNANFYPNFRAKDLSGSTDEAAKTIVDEMKGNLEFLYQFADKKDKVWYDGARAIVDDRAKLFGFNEASVAGVIAAMSPQKEWDDNVHQADMVMETYKNQQGYRWDGKMNEWSKTHWSVKNQPLVDLVRGKKLGELTDPKEKALWIRTYDETHNSPNYRVVQANGALGDFKKNDDGALSKMRWQSLPAIKSAVVALEANGDRDKISSAMGAVHKVRSFYNNILDPHSANGDVTIDTHAVGAALLRQLAGADAAVIQNFGNSPEKKNKPEGWEGTSSSTKTGLSGTYAIYAEAYREAAKDLGIQPRQLQSIVWVAKRKTFGEASEKKQQAIEMAWHDYHDNKQTLEQTRDSIANILELKKNERRVDGYDGGERRTADTRELHRSGVGSAAAGMDGGAGSGAAGRIARLVAIRNARRQASAQEVTTVVNKEMKAAATRWAAIRARALRTKANFNPDEPREGGKWSGGGGGDGGAEKPDASDEEKPSGSTNYGLVPGDVEKFHALKDQWSKVNSDLLDHVDKPDSPEAQAIITRMEGITKDVQKLHADPGTPEGIGLPGGPRDVTIIGAGPGGLMAAINGGAEGLDTLVIDKNVVAGGQAKFSSRVENFGGFPIGVKGSTLTQNMFTQAKRMGADDKLGVAVTGLAYNDKTGMKTITLADGTKIDSRTVILAGGVEFKQPAFEGGKGSGVVVGDGEKLTAESAGGIAVVYGGSNGAAQAALGCATKADHVYLLSRSPIEKSMSSYVIGTVRNQPKITVITGEISKIGRDAKGNLVDCQTKDGKTIPCKAVGVFIGSVPETNWLEGRVARNDKGLIQTDADFQTGVPGVFAVGDQRIGGAGRIGEAVGEGQHALRQAYAYLDSLKKTPAAPAAKAYTPPRLPIAELFDLDRANPWFGTTVEGAAPPEPPHKTKGVRAMTSMKTRQDDDDLPEPMDGESRDDYIERCGDTLDDPDEADDVCGAKWDADGDITMMGYKEFADPGYRGDGKKRYPTDTPNLIRQSWFALHQQAAEYTDGQMSRIQTRITNAWKVQISAEGPPKDKAMIELLQRKPPSQPTVLHKVHSTEGTGMEFVLSDATPDRFGDVVEPAGWVVDNFKSNPIALFNHDSGFPIGRWENIKIGDKDLRARLVLAPKGTSDRIDEIRNLIDADILRATSVGFKPIDSVPMNVKDPWSGQRYTKHELVECSVVAVPANPNALAVAKSLGVSAGTLRVVFGEHADKGTVQRRDFSSRGEHADKTGGGKKEESQASMPKSDERHNGGKPMLLSKRIQDAEKAFLALQDNLDKHLETIDDANPTDDQMVLTEDLTSKIETAQRHLANLKAIEAKNATGAVDAGSQEHQRRAAAARAPAGLLLKEKKADPLDYMVRAALVRCKSKADGVDIDVTRRKIYGDDEVTRVMCDIMLKAASAPAETTVTGWAAELVRTMWAQFMEVLLPQSVYPKLSAAGLALTFGANGRIVIPTRSLTPSISGSFVGEGQPIPVRQGAFSSQTLTPKKMAVITTWTREMDEYSIPAIEGLLRQAIIEDTAISLDTVLLDANVATAIRPPGLRSYQTGLTPSAVTPGFINFTSDYKQLYGTLLNLTAGNVRSPVLILNPTQTLGISLMQPPNAATPLFPFIEMVNAGRILRAGLIESATVPVGMAVMVDAADFTSAGEEGPRMEISDQATLHMEDTTPQDIVSGSAVVASPVKSMWQTDSLALRLIMRMNWILRRPVVAWMSGVNW